MSTLAWRSGRARTASAIVRVASETSTDGDVLVHPREELPFGQNRFLAMARSAGWTGPAVASCQLYRTCPGLRRRHQVRRCTPDKSKREQDPARPVPASAGGSADHDGPIGRSTASDPEHSRERRSSEPKVPRCRSTSCNATVRSLVEASTLGRSYSLGGPHLAPKRDTPDPQTGRLEFPTKRGGAPSQSMALAGT